MAAATVTCPLHARKIDLKTGAVLNDEMLSCTFTFPVKIEDGSIYLDTRALTPLRQRAPPEPGKLSAPEKVVKGQSRKK